eukprot:TRINITY_DN11553_c0_g1_i1.p1 TRINITY_DN11553_c0_g1~~TRINITY_DN11553_c0_g1_i1.p1  ORF type:complete len:296 (-),score=49.08 TRINITY_DN11553_c0_g1_i1:71-937(-)
MAARKTRVGIVGFGDLGQFLAKAILETPASNELELAFVWNRTRERIDASGIKLSEDLILNNLDDFQSKEVDIIVEVAHPLITKSYIERFLESADYIIGSPTALADVEVESLVRRLTSSTSPKYHGFYVPAGALWGAVDIKKMTDRGSLQELRITMAKHPESLKLEGHLKQKLEDNKGFEGEFIVYEGSVRELCPLAPNNVNTMAAAAIAAHNIGGFDGVKARLVADTRLDAHVIDIEVKGRNGFEVNTKRFNPAVTGSVTGTATYVSFLSSLLDVARQSRSRPGIHFC